MNGLSLISQHAIGDLPIKELELEKGLATASILLKN